MNRIIYSISIDKAIMFVNYFALVKRKLHPKKKILLSLIHPQIVPNLYKHTERNLEKCQILSSIY